MNKIIDFVPINKELICNPYNWVVVLLMTAVFGTGVHLIKNSKKLVD